MSRKVGSMAGILLLGAGIGGCANSDELKARVQGRWGPDPTIRATEFAAVVQNQSLVLGFIGRSAGYVGDDGRFRQMNPADWNDVAQWGFNIGRQDCEIYMENLFRISREKGRNDNVLSALGTAAAAIVTGTTTAQKPLSILAAVFGLTIALNDAIFQSFLFTQAPGLVAKKVNDLQEVFRNSVVTGQVQITSAASAYYAIQSYYHICLPHAIEGVMLQTIADSTPVTPPASGAGTEVVTKGGTSTRVKASPEPAAAIRTPQLTSKSK